MNKLNIAATGYPGTNKSWRFLHDAFAEPLEALAKVCGSVSILYGCELNQANNTVSDGWMAIEGELYYFEGGELTSANPDIYIKETIEQAAYNTDLNDDNFFDNLNTYYTRRASFNGQTNTGYAIGDFTRLKDLAAVTKELEYLKSGVFPGAIQMFSGAPEEIPTGWKLCNGNGTFLSHTGQERNIPNLGNKFIVGVGSEYQVNDTGGVKEVTLSEAQMPKHSHNGNTSEEGEHNHSGSTSTNGAHSHGYEKSVQGRGYATAADDYPLTGNQYATTSTTGNHSHSLNINSNGKHTHSISTEQKGNNQAHENRPPYYALCYIIFVGI